MKKDGNYCGIGDIFGVNLFNWLLVTIQSMDRD
jgi:hypothetical protein